MAAAAPAAAPSNRRAHLCAFVTCLALAVVVGAAIGLVCAFVRFSSSKKVDLAVGVETASLTRFALSSNNSLDYGLELNLTWSNNGGLGVYYYELQARAFYAGEVFGGAALPTFSQPMQNTTVVHAKIRGAKQMEGGSVPERFDREKGEGYYYIDLEVDVKLWTEKYDNRKAVMEAKAYSAEVDCSLRVPLASNGGMTNRFQRTECEVKF